MFAYAPGVYVAIFGAQVTLAGTGAPGASVIGGIGRVSGAHRWASAPPARRPEDEGAELSEAPIDPVHHDLVADTLGGARGHIGSPAGRRYLPSMTVRARVIKGRLVVDQPTPLPEGTVLDLVVDDEGTPLTPAERRAINASIDRAWLSAQAGKLRPATALIAKLRQRRAR
jgi:hypothetical protein